MNRCSSLLENLTNRDLLESSLLNDCLNVGVIESTLRGEPAQDDRYRAAVHHYGSSLERLIRAYEADPEKRRDLSQEIHFQLWRSFARYDSLCSLRTWVYRVAHHVAVSYVMRERRILSKLVSLEELESIQARDDGQASASRRITLEQLSALIQQLKPLDRQVIISYLEDMDAASIAEITGLSAASVSMRVYRIKNLLARHFGERPNHAK